VVVTTAAHHFPSPRILFPSRAAEPVRALALRIGVALGLLAVVALITRLGRDGYRDVDGTDVTLLDAIYYASVSVTTTGYGDITPVSPAARLVTSVVVTPARILFLIILVGTTIELLTQRFREAVAVSRWRKRMQDHIIIVGFGTKGQGAYESLIANGVATAAQVVAIDTDGNSIESARRAGITTVVGDGTRTEVLRQALVERARAIIVTCRSDDTATLVTLTARELNRTAVITAAVREVENVHLLEQSGANTVVVSSEASGRILGLATTQPNAVAVIDDILVAGRGLDLTERQARPDEISGAPQRDPTELPIAVVRRGERIPFDDARFARVEAGDVIVSLARAAESR
jgi:voltage-gated potassium channel